MYSVWFHYSFYKIIFDFENKFFIIPEEYFMLNLYQEAHFYIIFCYVLISQKTENTHTNDLLQISINDLLYN